MIDRHLEELMQRELDGETTPDESRRLRATLDADPEARRLYERLGELAERLAGVDLVDPPEELAQEIRQALAEPSGSPREGAVPGMRPALVPWPRRFARQAALFAAGLALGFAIHQIVDPGTALDPNGDRDFLSGTIAPADDTRDWAIVERVEIQEPQVDGLLEIRRRGPQILISATLRSARDLLVQWGFDPAALRVSGVHIRPVSLQAVRVESARVTAPHPGGEGTQRLLLVVQDDRVPPSLSIRIDGDAVLLQRSLDIRPEGTR